MDPNAALAQMREHIKDADDTTSPAGRMESLDAAIERAEALDAWLTKGGFLPDEWRRMREAGAVHPVVVDGMREVTFHWSTQHGTCHECGLPAAFYLPLTYVRERDVEQPPTDTNKRCSVCAANAAAEGEQVRRIDEAFAVVDTTLEGPDSVLERFASEQEASQFVESLPEFETGRYGIDGPEKRLVDRATLLAQVRAKNDMLGVDQPVLLVYGNPANGFRFIGPVIPNDPELDRFVDGELRAVDWWYQPLHTLEQAQEDRDLS